MITNRRARTATAVALTALTLTACSGTEPKGDSAPNGDAAEIAGIIATTKVWADIASAVTGTEVDAIIEGDAVDPHHFEPTAMDLARVKKAGTVVANGGAYDASLYTVTDQDKIIHAIPLLDAHDDHTHEDHAHTDHLPDSLDELEHAWFAPEKVRQVASQVKERVGGDDGAVDKRMREIEASLASVQHVHVAMTEPIAAGLIWGTELHDITPEEYVKASLNHQEPPASAVAAFIQQLEQRDVDMLFVNPQSENSATQRLVDAAKANNIPIVEIRETPPAGQNFLDYLEAIVGQVADIAAHAEPKPHH